MYKAEARLIIHDWLSIHACANILNKSIEEITKTKDAKSLQQNNSVQMIASAAIADELEKFSTKEVKSWARCTIFM